MLEREMKCFQSEKSLICYKILQNTSVHNPFFNLHSPEFTLCMHLSKLIRKSGSYKQHIYYSPWYVNMAIFMLLYGIILLVTCTKENIYLWTPQITDYISIKN